jgi:hypothetical protein
MNTVFLPWQAFDTNDLRVIEIDHHEVTLIYNNDTELALSFPDQDQLETFVSHLVGSLICQDAPDHVKWN